ncbi:MAG: hypothetical protein JNN11_03825 [Candidatus Doudnabacteria bacterium]|nr:hypothetical protein [Candidatus Doudnabacteria bacterium]
MLKVDAITNIFSVRSNAFLTRKTFSVEGETKNFFLVYALFAVNTALLLSYLLGVNTQASTGYEIKQLEKQTVKLGEEQRLLNLKLSEVTAISVLSQDFENAGFVSADAPKYIKVGSENTAMLK